MIVVTVIVIIRHGHMETGWVTEANDSSGVDEQMVICVKVEYLLAQAAQALTTVLAFVTAIRKYVAIISEDLGIPYPYRWIINNCQYHVAWICHVKYFAGWAIPRWDCIGNAPVANNTLHVHKFVLLRGL